MLTKNELERFSELNKSHNQEIQRLEELIADERYEFEQNVLTKRFIEAAIAHGVSLGKIHDKKYQHWKSLDRDGRQYNYAQDIVVKLDENTQRVSITWTNYVGDGDWDDSSGYFDLNDMIDSDITIAAILKAQDEAKEERRKKEEDARIAQELAMLEHLKKKYPGE